MYKQLKVLSNFKAKLTDAFTNEQETRNFIAGQIIEGRLDEVSGKLFLVLSDGFGGIVGEGLIQIN